MKVKRQGKIRSKVLFTVFVAIALSVAFLTVVLQSYVDVENSAFESLHMRTREIKEDIKLQMISDRENLQTIANMVETLYREGRDYNIIFDSFESIGLIKNIGILTPDNTMMTKAGSLNLDGQISFEEEASKSPYFSGRIEDITHPGQYIVRSSVPINVDNKTIGILYGMIDLNDVKDHYKSYADNMDARLYIIESGNGNFIVDTWSHELGNLNEARAIRDKKGYSYEAMREEIRNGGNGFCAYLSTVSKVFMYAHYAPIGVSDWEIVLSVPESRVFADVLSTRKQLFSIFFAVLFIMSMYMFLIFYSERKKTKVTACASAIRKQLLNINNKKSNIKSSLKLLCDFTKSDKCFFTSVDDDVYSYSPYGSGIKSLDKSDRDYLIAKIFEMAAKYHEESNTTLLISDIKYKEREKYGLNDIMNKYGIKNISFASIYDNDNHVNVLVVINPGKVYEARELLKDVSVCFSISVHNKNYLNKTEYEAVTDALTGVYNRVAYKKYIEKLDSYTNENFACVYVDVNELHSYNNKYGHSAGDEMLLCIANIIKDVFFGNNIFRMGGDEYLVFVEGTTREAMDEAVASLIEQTEKSGYHISVGMNFTKKNTDTDMLVREAEKRMYDAKALYYQSKEKHSMANSSEVRFKIVETGIEDIDMMLKIFSGRYRGIFSVSLADDSAHRIMMPSYMNFSENEKSFSHTFAEYVSANVHPDFHRGMLKFLNYDVLKRQLESGETLHYTYKKNNGEGVVLSIYAKGDKSLWVFETA